MCGFIISVFLFLISIQLVIVIVRIVLFGVILLLIIFFIVIFGVTHFCCLFYLLVISTIPTTCCSILIYLLATYFLSLIAIFLHKQVSLAANYILVSLILSYPIYLLTLTSICLLSHSLLTTLQQSISKTLSVLILFPITTILNLSMHLVALVYQIVSGVNLMFIT